MLAATPIGTVTVLLFNTFVIVTFTRPPVKIGWADAVGAAMPTAMRPEANVAARNFLVFFMLNNPLWVEGQVTSPQRSLCPRATRTRGRETRSYMRAATCSRPQSGVE